MKCYMILVLAVAFSLGNCNAQGQKKANEKKVEKTLRPHRVKSYFLSQLDGTEWTYHNGNHRDKYVRETVAFTNTKRIYSSVFFNRPKNNRIIHKSFYLSDTVPTFFDESLVGKVESGKYIVYTDGVDRTVSCWKIQKLTEDSLVLFWKYVPDPKDKGKFIVGGGHDVTLRFSRINSNANKQLKNQFYKSDGDISHQMCNKSFCGTDVMRSLN